MANNNSNTIFSGPSLGISFLGFLVLLVLKLANLVDISWIWVTCPLWIGSAACFVLWLWFTTLHVVVKTLWPVPTIIVPVPVHDCKDEEVESN